MRVIQKLPRNRKEVKQMAANYDMPEDVFMKNFKLLFAKELVADWVDALKDFQNQIDTQLSLTK